MEYFVQFAVTYLRSKLTVLLESEPTSYDDLHSLVQELLNLQEEFQGLVNFIEDIENCNF